MAAPFRLYSTLSRTVEAFEPLVPGRVSLYVCGMTVYADAHVGHARAFIVFDSFVRWLRARGWQVTFVRNFTDIDDKIINAAAKTGEDSAALADRFVDAWHRDAASLGLLPPDVEPRVTTSIPEIQSMIGALLGSGHAYENEGSVWFSVPADSHYGQLSGQKVDELRSADTGTKRHSADFALWKGVKPGEPAWPSPWGPGRPGWHIECSAMAKKTLGDQIDIHGGGLDLVFPHHENEVAQSECANGKRPFARYWMHNGLLMMSGGAKMGKSEGNAVNIVDLVQLFPAEALRIYYLQTAYRSPLPWSAEALPDALALLARLYEAREVGESFGGTEPPDRLISDLGKDAREVWDLANGFEDRFQGALSDDFNTAKALGYAFELARAVNRLGNHKQAKKRAGPIVEPALRALATLQQIGLLQLSSAEFQEQVKQRRLSAMGVERSTVEAMIADRLAARAGKDWARADALRVDLDKLGIVVMDRADGVDWRVRLESRAE